MADSKVITRNDVQNILAHINLGDDSHQEITQADFDALSDEEKNSGTIYFITNGTNNNIFLDDNTPIGTIAPYGGSSDPAYWLICDGRAISRTAYADLFTVIGTTYGAGDGSTTFNIPDLRGNVAIGASQDYDLGDTGGEVTHTLTGNEMPVHGHPGIHWGSPTGLEWSDAGSARSGYPNTVGGGTIAAGSWYAGNSGGGQAHNNMQPYVVTNYIIKASSALSEHQSQLDFFYPIGSYYETTSSNFNPSSNWGGTWELINKPEQVAWAVWHNGVITNSYGFTSIVETSTGTYNCTLTEAMANENYSIFLSAETSGRASEIVAAYPQSTTLFVVDISNYNGTAVTPTWMFIKVEGYKATPTHYKWHRVA